MIKKLFTTTLIMMLTALSSFAETSDSAFKPNEHDRIALYKQPIRIEDELVKSTAFPKIFPSFVKDNSPITDELMENIEPFENTIKLFIRKNAEKQNPNIEDELVTPKFKAKVGTISVLKVKQKNKIEDNFIKNNFKSGDKLCVKPKTKYDFSKKQIPVPLKVIKNITTKGDVSEGTSVLFETARDVEINGIKLPKGTNIIGRVETISASDKMGTPANMIIDNFYVKSNPDICFYGSITKTGANRSLWVYPLYQAGNLIFYAAGFVFVPIHGGHAKLSTKETYTVFYETN